MLGHLLKRAHLGRLFQFFRYGSGCKLSDGGSYAETEPMLGDRQSAEGTVKRAARCSSQRAANAQICTVLRFCCLPQSYIAARDVALITSILAGHLSMQARGKAIIPANLFLELKSIDDRKVQSVWMS